MQSKLEELAAKTALGGGAGGAGGAGGGGGAAGGAAAAAITPAAVKSGGAGGAAGGAAAALLAAGVAAIGEPTGEPISCARRVSGEPERSAAWGREAHLRLGRRVGKVHQLVHQPLRVLEAAPRLRHARKACARAARGCGGRGGAP